MYKEKQAYLEDRIENTERINEEIRTKLRLEFIEKIEEHVYASLLDIRKSILNLIEELGKHYFEKKASFYATIIPFAVVVTFFMSFKFHRMRLEGGQFFETYIYFSLLYALIGGFVGLSLYQLLNPEKNIFHLPIWVLWVYVLSTLPSFILGMLMFFIRMRFPTFGSWLIGIMTIGLGCLSLIYLLVKLRKVYLKLNLESISNYQPDSFTIDHLDPEDFSLEKEGFQNWLEELNIPTGWWVTQMRANKNQVRIIDTSQKVPIIMRKLINNDSFNTPKEIVEALNGEVNTTDIFGWSPLEYAAVYGEDQDLSIALLNAGADPNKTVVDTDKTIFLEVMRNQLVDLILVASYLDNGANISVPGVGDAFCFFVENFQIWDEKDYVPIAQLLLIHGADVNASNNGIPLLHLAAKYKPKLLDVLIESGADINQRNTNSNDGPLVNTIFSNATKQNWQRLILGDDSYLINIISKLIAAGADVNATDVNGWSALHCALDSRGGKIGEYYFGIKAIKMLIEAGVDVNAITDAEEWSPLLIAISNADVNSIELLLEAGADVTLCFDDVELGETSFLHKATLELCEDAGSCRERKIVVKQLLDWGLDTNGIDRDGESILELVVRYGLDREVVTWFLEAGAYVNYKTLLGHFSILHIAAKDAPGLVDLLIKYGANIEDRDDKGKTPFDYYTGNDPEIKKLLREGI